MGRENADLESRKLYWAHPGESSVSSPLGFSRRLTELFSFSSRSPNLLISRVLSEEEKNAVNYFIYSRASEFIRRRRRGNGPERVRPPRSLSTQLPPFTIALE